MHQEKQTKNVITKESIAQELLKDIRYILCFYIIAAIVMAAIVSILFLVAYTFGMKGRNIPVIGYVLFFLLIPVAYSPLLLLLRIVPDSLKKKKSLLAGAFFVDTDEVVYKMERTKRRPPRGTPYEEKIVHFYKHGDVRMKGTWYQLAEKGDTFYMVLYEQDAAKPVAYYPTKLYEYKG